MKLKPVIISLLLYILIAFLSTACGSVQEEVSAPSEEVVPTKSETLKELEAMEPTFVVHFDGKECLVEGPSEINTGDHLFVLHNQLELPAAVALGSYFGDGSYEDHFQWREENCAGPDSDHFECEENCGGQGAHCSDGENLISYTHATWYQPKKMATEGRKTYYKLIEIKHEREHVIWVELDRHWGWMCQSFQVTK